MRYDRITTGIFLDRPNRFIAYCGIGDSIEKCHVKNTGRCRELLIPGTKVILSVPDNTNRSTPYDLIAVWKGNRLINMDSQIPNSVAEEGLKKIPLFSDVETIKREFTYGDSRIDILAEGKGKRYLVEVKGVTLEDDGVVRFPDAPTERGVKHIRELMHCMKDGYIPCLLFVIQMEGVDHLEPNRITDPAFSDTLKEAYDAGVHVFAYDCRVTEDSIELKDPVEILL